MKRTFMMIFSLALFANLNAESNPLLEDWKTPFGTPPFDRIKTEHYLPAFKEAIELHKKEINDIIENEDKPTFQNTIAPLDYSGSKLKQVQRVFSAMNESMSSNEMTQLSKEISPMLSKHKDDINLNEDLFKRVKTVYDNKDEMDLTTEENKVLEKYYKDFVRGGANLSDKEKEIFREINRELSILSVQFGENVLKETNKFELIIDKVEDLAGLPENVISTASNSAKEKGYENKWLFTIHKPSMIPFLQYSSKRDLREKLYKAYINKGDNNDELDNKKILSKMAMLRVTRANLLGYNTHADYVLEENMAGNPNNVYELLDKLWKPALERAKGEVKEMQNIIDKENGGFKLEPWDWWYYAEKVKKEKYDLDEDELRPYFEVNNVIKGVFTLSESLFGIQFEERNDISKYHPDVKVFEVKEADGTHIGILYTDYFPRESKRGGAWMDEFRRQHKKDGKMITPIIYNVGNFSKPTGDKPALLSLDEVHTLFHEFGHALHGLLSNCTYESVAATETPRDFVEFPSQVMENWALHPDVVKSYAVHYQTGEVIPDELLNKVKNAALFNQGFATVEYLAASYLDMNWHTITEPIEYDAAEFETSSMKKIGLIDEIIPRYRSTYFNHIFSGGYSAGYYSYIWSEVLDADAFNAFVESGNVLNKDLAAKYRKYILSAGGSDDSMKLYELFRGSEPDINALIKKRGLN
ncbi:MAG: M3 family metallopeptidase [Melioribacteraceae bacterium]|nr:M3 family metallopeptidase [Melioribacteraceae bacterium]